MNLALKGACDQWVDGFPAPEGEDPAAWDPRCAVADPRDSSRQAGRRVGIMPEGDGGANNFFVGGFPAARQGTFQDDVDFMSVNPLIF